MKKYLVTLTLAFSVNAFSQKKQPIIYDSTDVAFRFIDFSIIDTLDNWNYELDLTYRGFKNDSLKSPIGRILFFRKKRLPGRVYIASPYIRFNIYPITDSLMANRYSKRTMGWSSCGGPFRGGELLVVGNFIFVNPDVCTYCMTAKYEDTCRPLIDYIFSKIVSQNPTSLDQLISHLPLKKGKSKIHFVN